MKSNRSAATKSKKCYGCGSVYHQLPIKALMSRREFCSIDCMHTNYFRLSKDQSDAFKKVLERDSKK